jgi:hypothetical protein
MLSSETFGTDLKMTALRTYFPTLAARLGESAVQFNQWLQALVAAGVLLPRPGLGPGSGVELSGKSLATFLLAVLASDNRGEAVERAKELVRYVPAEKTGRCRFTGATNLRDAIATALEKRLGPSDKPIFLQEIQLHRGPRNVVVLHWRQAQKDYWKNYWPEDLCDVVKSPAKRVIVSFNSRTIGDIAGDIRELTSAENDGEGA